MNFGFFNQLVEKGGLWGLLLAIAITTILYLFKMLIHEKDEEIKDARAVEEKITLVLSEVDSTMKTILILLEKGERIIYEKKKRI